jgi:small subunit ribosomal protein S2
MINFRDLVKHGVHFGHQKTRWCPKMAPYIWGVQNNIHLIDVSKTAFQLEKAAQFLEGVAAQGKRILWVGTKKAARDAVMKAAVDLKMPYVCHRWIGGTLSNNSQVKKSVTNLLHFEDILANAEKYPLYIKKEFNKIQKDAERLNKSVGGIKNLAWPVGAIVLVDVSKERSALKEAAAMGIPVVAIVDTNSDPSFVDIVIPGNDDSKRSIICLLEPLVEAVRKGATVAQESVAKEKEEKAVAAKHKKDAAGSVAKKSASVKEEPKVVVEQAEVVIEGDDEADEE